MASYYWLFVINNTLEEFRNRIEKKSWPIFKRTQNRGNLFPGDFVVFYKAGKDGQRFLGKANLNSEAEKFNSLIYAVKLKNITMWKKGVEITEIVNDLLFIGNPKLWGNYLQGGVKKITERDYNLITSKSR